MAVSYVFCRTPDYTLNGIQDEFSFSFPVEDASQITVWVKSDVGPRTQQQLTSGWSASATNDDWTLGGKVTLNADTVAAHPSGTLVIIRSTPQNTELLPDAEVLSVRATVNQIDDLQRQIHELQEQLDRTPKYQETDSFQTVLPDKTDRAGLLFGWNADGHPIGAWPADFDGSVIVSALALTLLDDATTAEMRATLEIKERYDELDDHMRTLSQETTLADADEILIDDDSAVPSAYKRTPVSAIPVYLGEKGRIFDSARRCRIVQAEMDQHNSFEGYQSNFIRRDASDVNQWNLEASSVPLIMSFSDGFDSLGPVEYLHRETSQLKPANWRLTDHVMRYFYAKRAAGGAVSYHADIKKPLMGKILDTYQQFYYDVPDTGVLRTEDKWGNPISHSGAVASAAQTHGGKAYSLSFDGANDYFTYDNLQHFTRGTIEWWAYFNASGATEYLIGTPHVYRILVQKLTTDKLHLSLGYSGSWFINGAQSVTTVPIGEWVHIAVTLDEDGFTAFINGKLACQGVNRGVQTPDMATHSWPVMFDDGLQIGNYNNHASNGFNGYISEFRITHGHVLYKHTFTPPTTLDPNAVWFDGNEMKWKEGNPEDGWSYIDPRVYLGESIPRSRMSVALNFEDNEPGDTEVYLDAGPKTTFYGSGNVLDTDGTMNAKFGSRFGSFDGAGDWLTIGDALNFSTYDYAGPPVQHPWEFDCWVFTRDTAQINQAIVGWDDGSHGLLVAMEPTLGANGQIRIYMSGNGSSWDLISNQLVDVTINANTWYHFAVGWTGEEYYFCWNGVRIHTLSSTVPIWTGIYAYYMGTWLRTGWWLDGGVDAVRFRSDAFAFPGESTINTYNQATYTVPTSAPIPWTNRVKSYMPGRLAFFDIIESQYYGKYANGMLRVLGGKSPPGVIHSFNPPNAGSIIGTSTLAPRAARLLRLFVRIQTNEGVNGYGILSMAPFDDHSIIGNPRNNSYLTGSNAESWYIMGGSGWTDVAEELAVAVGESWHHKYSGNERIYEKRRGFEVLDYSGTWNVSLFNPRFRGFHVSEEDLIA